MDQDDQPTEDRLGWVTDFDNPAVAKPRDKRSASRPERFAVRLMRSHPAVVPLLAGAGALAAVVAIVFAALSRTGEEETGTGALEPEGRVAVPTVSAPTATSKPGVSSRLPATCADIYSADMKRVLAQSGLEVNSAWTGSRNLPGGTGDAELLTLLTGNDSLECSWLDEYGGAESALLTVLVDTTEATTQAAMARLSELGLTRREENGGVRFFIESRDGADELQGESHFFRDGFWFATRWYGTGQYGYTADMAQTVF